MTGAPRVRVSLLGPVELFVGDTPVPLAGARPRTLVALLALRAGEPVPVWRIVEALWEGDPPAGARNQIQVYVSRLRRSMAAAGGADVLHTRGEAYELAVAPDDVDAHRFTRLLTYHPERVREALALWRGEALADVPSPALGPEAAALADARVTALERRIDLDLAADRHAELVPELRGLVGRMPLHEGLRCRLMTALVGTGRAGEAMDVYRAGRRLLRDELGIEPGEELRAAARAVERGGFRPPSAVAGGCSLPAAVRGFVGRRAELDLLRTHLDAAGDPPAVAVVTGAAGVGKSTLAVRAAHELRGRYPDGQLFLALRGGQGEPMPPTEALALLLRGMGVPGAAVPDNLAERLIRYRAVVAERRMLIVLDDAAGEHQIRPLLPGAGASAVLVTSRSRLVGLDDAYLVELDALGRAESIRLLRGIAGAGRLTAGTADRIAALCGDHPLAVRIAAARLAERSHLAPRRLVAELADERSRLDALRAGDLEVRASLQTSYARLPSPVRRALRLLSVADIPQVPLWAVAAVLDAPADRAGRLGDALADARLLTAVADDTGEVRLGFHDLVRLFGREKAATDEPVAGRDAATARLAAVYLSAAEEANRQLLVGLIPTRPLPARRHPPPDDCLARIRADPLRWFADELAALVGLVRERLRAGDVHTAGALAAAMAHFLEKGNYFDQWWDTHDAVLRAARAAGAGQVVMAMARGLGDLHTIRDEWPEAEQRLTETLTLARRHDDHSYATAALAGLGYICRLTGRYADSVQHFRAAARAARRDGNPNGEIHAACGEAAVLFEQGRHDPALARYLRCVRDSRAVGYRAVEAQALRGVALVHLERGEIPPAVAALGRARDISATLGDQLVVAYATQLLAHAHALAGEHQRAEELLHEVEPVFASSGSRYGQAMVLLTRAVVALGTDRTSLARELLEQADKAWDALRMPYWHGRALELLGVAGERLGDPAAARKARDRARAVRAEAQGTGPDPAPGPDDPGDPVTEAGRPTRT